MIEVIRFDIENDKLNRECWEFMYLDGTMYVEQYSVESRKTARHGWTVQRQYKRLEADRRMTSVRLVPPGAVPLTQSIIARAKKIFFDRLDVTIWEEKHKR